jgi:arylamine N-acetyltransferase
MKRFHRIHKNKNRHIRRYKQVLCYSANGFLVDLLENNGFAVNSLNCHGPTKTEYTLNISLVVNRSDFTKLLDNRLKQINQYLCY